MSYRHARWNNLQGTVANLPAFIRKNVSVTDDEMHKRPVAVIVNLAYQGVSDSGLPDDEQELTLMDQFEERLADRVEQSLDAVFALAVTSDGTRDLFFYVPAPPSEDDLEDLIFSLEPPVNFDFSFHQDPDWHPYRTLA